MSNLTICSKDVDKTMVACFLTHGVDYATESRVIFGPNGCWPQT